MIATPERFRRSCIAIAMAAAALAAPAYSQEAALRVVVMPFEAQAGVSAADAAAMTEIVRSAIAITNEFSLIETQAAEAILAESGFGQGGASVDEASRLLAERLDAAYAITGAMSAADGGILISVRLIDAATARVIFVHRATSSAAAIHRDARRFAEGIANEVVAMTAGATIDNIERLVTLGRLDEASRKLDAARLRSAGAPEAVSATLDALEDRIDAGLAELAYKAARAAVAQAAKAKKDPEAQALSMASARESGTEALFLVPDDPAWAKQRERYLSYMRDFVMSYYAAEDRSRRAALAASASQLLKMGYPDQAIALIADYVQVAGERSIDKSILSVLERSKAARADSFVSSARAALSSADFRRAERLLAEAAEAGIEPSRFAYERARLEAAALRDAEARLRAERFSSPSWDPASRPALSLELGVDLSTIDAPSAAWPLGGITPMARLSAALYERVAGPILFDWRLALRAGRAQWAGALDLGDAALSYWRADAGLLAGFTVAARDIDAGLGAGAIAGAAGFSGGMDAYGTAEAIDEPLAPYLGAALRGKIRYRPTKRFGAGLDLERSLTWNPAAGISMGLAIGFSAEVSF